MRRRSLFSQSWHHVAELRPRLLPHTRIYRHVYRGHPWFVVQDAAGGRYHRLSPQAHTFVSRMNGATTVQELWDEACRSGGDGVPTQEEVVELLMQLYTNDLLDCDVNPDAAELFERFKKRRFKKWMQWFGNPLSLRFPLVDPDAFLTRWSTHLTWLFGVRGMVLWLAVVLPAMVLAAEHWRELTENLSDRIMAANNLLLLALLFPLIKALHELGHGFATKVWGGSVHEVGIMFLVFAPVPYVDASAASAFRSKHRRAVVGAAGMLVEVFLAALAMYIWALAEPGVVRAAAFNVMLIAGVSTIIVNGNPLLRYDGYYILVDLIEIPNLAQRGQRYLTFLCDRYLFGARELQAPNETPAEKRWLVSYAVGSWFYRLFVTITIILFIASEFFIFGVLLALWATVKLLFLPIVKAVKHIKESPTLQRQRGKAAKIATAIAVSLVSFTCFVPMPLYTQAEGVVWLPDQAQVRAGANGFFQHWLVAPGTFVSRGTPLLVMEDPQLSTEFKAARARLAEAASRYRAVQFTDLVQAGIVRQQLEHERRALNKVAERHSRLVVYSETAGVLTVAQPADMEGQHFKQGVLLGYILDQQQLVAQVAVIQDDIHLVMDRLKGVEIRFSDDIPRTYHVPVLRQVPSAVDELPTAALSQAGGGRIPVDPKDPNGLKTLERVFLFDIRLPEEAPPGVFGGRVYVRFSHVWEPLMKQWYRRLRQLFLSQFYV